MSLLKYVFFVGIFIDVILRFLSKQLSVNINKNNKEYLSFENPWIWTCNNETNSCNRKLMTYVSHEEQSFTSIELCRLLCGEYGSLWPKPSISTKMENKLIQIYPGNIKFINRILPNDTNNLLKEIKNVFLHKPNLKCLDCEYVENIIKIRLNFEHDTSELHPDVDESYQLTIETKLPNIHVNISSITIFGARHGLETLYQMIAINKTLNKKDNTTMWMISKVSIDDKPQFRHRGLLIDTARHYLNLSTIKRQIDALGISKMNVLHWHATDTQSFPILLNSVPELAQFGAYSPEKIYTLTDIQDVIRYAKIRGVRVILEIDTPGHVGNGWQFGNLHGLGELGACINYSPYKKYCLQPPCGQINPTNKNIFDVLEKIFKDIQKVYSKNEYFHLGGDEVSASCWYSSKEIKDYINNFNKTFNEKKYLKLWIQYQKELLNAYDNAFKSGNRKTILWSSALTKSKSVTEHMDKERHIVQIWESRGSKLPHRLLREGYQIIVSPNDVWYLDHGILKNTIYSNWERIFKNKLPKHKNVIGGEVCMWGEYADDHNIDAKIWPRAAAAAERLWTNSIKDHSQHVENRFYQHRERLVASKIEAEPLVPEWCVYNEGLC